MDLYLQGIAGAIAKLAALDPDVIDAAVASLVVSGAATGIAMPVKLGDGRPQTRASATAA